MDPSHGSNCFSIDTEHLLGSLPFAVGKLLIRFLDKPVIPDGFLQSSVLKPVPEAQPEPVVRKPVVAIVWLQFHQSITKRQAFASKRFRLFKFSVARMEIECPVELGQFVEGSGIIGIGPMQLVEQLQRLIHQGANRFIVAAPLIVKSQQKKRTQRPQAGGLSCPDLHEGFDHSSSSQPRAFRAALHPPRQCLTESLMSR